MPRFLNITGMTPLDIAAIASFFAFWAGYARYHRRRAARLPTLMSVVNAYRRDWMVNAMERDFRIVDITIVANLASSSTFFASTTVIILGGLLAMLGTKEKVVSVVAELPFAAKTAEELWDLKIVFLILIFTYAFFLFTWSLRQFNFCSIVLGAAPTPTPGSGRTESFAQSAGRLVSLAGDSFNDGLRAYYFALAALTWFVHPVLLIVVTGMVVLILYWREFRSRALRALIEGRGQE